MFIPFAKTSQTYINWRCFSILILRTFSELFEGNLAKRNLLGEGSDARDSESKRLLYTY